MISDSLVDAFRPWITPDLEIYLRAVGSMFATVEQLTEGGEDGLWSLFDPDLCPAFALPYLAQYVGEILPVGISEPAAREWIKDAPNQRRGTVMSIVRVAQRSLTGERTVQIIERAGVGGTDDPDRIIIHTYTSETPSPSSVLSDLDDAVPADIWIVYQTIDGQTWADVDAAYATWAAVDIDVANWEELRSPTPGFTAWTRPRSW